MAIVSNLLGNASEEDRERIGAEVAPVLAPGEVMGRAFRVFRDLFVFTNHRMILVDRHGVTGTKVTYHTILYRAITQFSVETAGPFDADSELKIWVSGGLALQKTFKRGADIVGLQQSLAECVFKN